MPFKGNQASKIIKPANALRPSNLHESNQNRGKKRVEIMFRTDLYKNRPPIRISKGAEKGYDTMSANSEKLNYIYLRRDNRAKPPFERS